MPGAFFLRGLAHALGSWPYRRVPARLTANFTKLPLVMGVCLTAKRPYPSHTPIGAGSQKLILLTIWAHEGQLIVPRIIADACGLSSVHTERGIVVLRRRGLIRSVTERPPGSSQLGKRYYLCIDKIRECQFDAEDVYRPVGVKARPKEKRICRATSPRT